MTTSTPVPRRQACSRGLRAAFGNRSSQAVFLCYHRVGEDGPPALTVKPDTFERQLASLRRRGYQSGDQRTLRALAAGWRPGRPRVFLTFDDGFYETFEQAFPLLRAYGFTALVFLVPPLVDAAGALCWPEMSVWCEQYPGALRSVGWDEVQAMADAGIEFGSHTCRHRSLPDLDDEQLRQELVDSRARIKERLGSCDTIAYPFGGSSPRVAAAALDAGYSFGFSLPYGSARVGWQRGATPMSIPRIAVEDRDDERRFALKRSPAGRRVLLSPVKAGLRAVQPWSQRVRGSRTSAVELPSPIRKRRR